MEEDLKAKFAKNTREEDSAALFECSAVSSVQKEN
jgi:hypothetical protein